MQHVAKKRKLNPKIDDATYTQPTSLTGTGEIAYYDDNDPKIDAPFGKSDLPTMTFAQDVVLVGKNVVNYSIHIQGGFYQYWTSSFMSYFTAREQDVVIPSDAIRISLTKDLYTGKNLVFSGNVYLEKGATLEIMYTPDDPEPEPDQKSIKTPGLETSSEVASLYVKVKQQETFSFSMKRYVAYTNLKTTLLIEPEVWFYH